MPSSPSPGLSLLHALDRPLISIILPCLDEEAVLAETLSGLDRMASGQPDCRFEFIFVDDGSRDRTAAILREAAARDPRARLLRFARNFGQQIAVSAGIEVARGDAVVLMDADLQDPPEVVAGAGAACRRGAVEAEAERGGWVIVAALADHLLVNATSEIRVLRYLAPMLPVLAVVAAVSLARLRPVALAVALAAAGWWGWGAVRACGQHPRLIATAWMRGLPAGSAIANETGWDESLPVLQAFPVADWSTPPGPFATVAMDVTDPEGPGTAARLAGALAQADYVVISSGRQIEVMPRLPERFPTVTRYYRALLAGELCFTRVLHLDRGYPLPFWRLDDSFAQEAWRLYAIRSCRSGKSSPASTGRRPSASCRAVRAVHLRRERKSARGVGNHVAPIVREPLHGGGKPEPAGNDDAVVWSVGHLRRVSTRRRKRVLRP